MPQLSNFSDAYRMRRIPEKYPDFQKQVYICNFCKEQWKLIIPRKIVSFYKFPTQDFHTKSQAHTVENIGTGWRYKEDVGTHQILRNASRLCHV